MPIQPPLPGCFGFRCSPVGNRGSLAVVLFTLLVVTLAAGCGGKNSAPVTPVQETGSAAQSETDACRSRLESAVRRLRPESLAGDSGRDRRVTGLNAWLAECAAQNVQSLEVSPANLRFLGPAAQRTVSAPRFTSSDADYVRDSLIMSRLALEIAAQADAAGGGSETQRIVNVFRWVVNNISLRDPSEPDVPAGVFDILLTGRGDARARAWIFAGLLRQLQRDAVLLLPSDATDDSEFLVAACLDDRLLLFDTQLGLPVATVGDDSLLIDDPAGGDSLVSQDRWKSPQVRIIVQTAAVCPRMLVLQEELPAESSAVLYEELAGGTSEIRPLVERVLAAAPDLADPEQFTIWQWPSEQVTAAASLDEEQRRTRTSLLRKFEAPFERDELELETDFRDLLSQPDLTPDQRTALWARRFEEEYFRMMEMLESDELSSEKLFGRPSSQLLRVRLSQIEGGHGVDIIQQLQKIRTACIDDAISFVVPPPVDPSGRKSVPLPEAIRMVNRRVTGDTLYWAGICQMDRGEPGTAIRTFQNYRRQYPDGLWFYASLMNQAIAEIAQGRPDAAATTLAAAAIDANPEEERARALLERLPQQPSKDGPE